MNSRFMNFREGKKVSWLEMLAIIAALASVVTAFLVWAEFLSAPRWLAVGWALSGVLFALFAVPEKRWWLAISSILYSCLWVLIAQATFPLLVYSVLGFALGVILSILIGS